MLRRTLQSWRSKKREEERPDISISQAGEYQSTFGLYEKVIAWHIREFVEVVVDRRARADADR